MIKYCKSCGKEYKGDWCEHCGFGKPDNHQKSLDKYKKYTLNKKDKYLTDEEKAERAELFAKKWEELKKDSESRVLKKPAKKSSGWGFIALVFVVFVGVVILLLWQSGVIFSSDKRDVITTYFNSIQTGDFEGYISTMVEPMAQSYRDEAKKQGIAESDFLRQSYADYEEGFGAGYTISLTFGSEEEMSANEISASEKLLKDAYGEDFNIKEAYRVAISADYKGSKSAETVNYYVYIGKIKGDWYILNIDG